MAGARTDAVERLQRGLMIALIAIVAILVAVLALRMMRGGSEVVSPIASQTGTADTTSSVDVSERLAAARGAMAGSRLVSPAGDNAYEHYLSVLAQQPDNVSAREALNDLYGIAVSSAEQAIAAGDFEDAERLAGLLSQSNPNSFTVVNLRQRIERGQAAIAAAEAAQQQRETQAQQAPDPAAAPPSTTAASVPEPASDLASVTSPTTTQPSASAAASQPSSSTGAPPTTTPARTTTTTPAATLQPVVPAVREARLLSRVDPEYPREAMRGRQQGWVEVEFTIGSNGTVSDARVVASRPSRIFDRAATRAVQEWRFEPRMENGQPVASRLRQRFDFRLD